MRANVQFNFWGAIERNGEEWPYYASLLWQPNEKEDLILRIYNDSPTGLPIVGSVSVVPNGHTILQGWTVGHGPLNAAGLIEGPTQLRQGAEQVYVNNIGCFVINVRIPVGTYAELRIPVVHGATTDDSVLFVDGAEDTNAGRLIVPSGNGPTGYMPVPTQVPVAQQGGDNPPVQEGENND